MGETQKMNEAELRERCLYWEDKAEAALRAAQYAKEQLSIHVGYLALLLEPDVTNVVYMDEFISRHSPDPAA